MQYVTSDSVKGYTIQKKIGAGGFGEVYLATESRPNFEREVALKIISPTYANEPNFIRRFENEAQLVARLEYPYIVPLYDYWRGPDGAYLVMRWLPGGSVKDALADGPLELEAIARILNQVCSALALAHRKGVIHRDIKPGNILLDDEGNAYLGDFGIAKDFVGYESITQPEDIIGSPKYISPEQARTELVSPRTDVYSLGVTLYEMLSGEHPFPKANMYDLIFKHINEPLPELTHLDAHLRDEINAVIQKATAKNPVNRYADAREFAQAFHEAAHLEGALHAESIEEQLTIREQQILSLVAEGKSNKEIAQELVVAMDTVRWHLRNAYKKLGVQRREQAIVKVRNLTLVGGDATLIPDDTSRYLIDFEPDNPYKGLEAFTYADAGQFYGRTRLIEKLILRMQQDHPHQRFLAVLGPSGSGKSSLVRAGLVPALWEGKIDGSDQWIITDMIPRHHPIDELEVALRQIAAKHADGLGDILTQNERGLVKAAQLITPQKDSELLILIDQFEEVFTLVEDEKERVHFLDLISTAITDPDSRVRVVITIRADFYDRPLYYSPFADVLRDRVETVLPLSADELEAAIAQPAKQVGVKFEDGLVATIISDINYQPGALPLLQYALLELFEKREGRGITRQAYQDIGSTVGALAKRAENLYDEFSDEGRNAIRQMFMRLVTLGEGTEDARRRADRSELLAISEQPALMDEVIYTFAEYRLLALDHDPVTREPTVEVAHEAILREWERLRNWLNESRDDIKQQRQLATLAAEWEAHRRSVDFLVRGSRLDQFQSWTESTALTLTPNEQAFLDASLVDREKRETQARVQAKREASLEQRARRVLQALVAVFLIAAIIAGVLALFALNAEATAEDERDNAVEARTSAERNAAKFRSVALASGAQEANFIRRPHVALALALEAMNMDDPPEQARRVFFDIATTSWMRHQYDGRPGGLFDGKFLADGEQFVTVSRDGEIKVWDVESGDVVLSYHPESGGVGFVDIHPSTSLIAVGRNQQGLLLWNLETDEKEFLNFDLDVLLNPVAFSDDGTQLIAGGNNGQLFIIDLESRALERTVDAHEPGFTIPDGNFSPDGKLLVTAGSNDGTARVFDTTTWEQLAIFDEYPTGTWIWDAQFLPDGKQVILGGTGNLIYLWDWQADEIIWSANNGSAAQDIVLTPDGKYFISGNNAPLTHISIWELETGELVRTYEGHRDRVQNVDISPDGSRILSISLDGTAKIWDTWDDAVRYILPVPSINFDVDNDIVVAFDADATRFFYQDTSTNVIKIRDIATGQLIQSFTLDYPISNVAHSPSGQFVLVFGEQGLNRTNLLNLETGDIEEWEPLKGDIVISWDFSPTGRFLVTQELGGGTFLRDTLTGEVAYQLTDEGGMIVFSLDEKSFYGQFPNDHTIGEWRVDNGELIRAFTPTDDPYNAPQDISDDGSTILALSGNEVKVWDVETGEIIRTLTGHTSFAHTAEFSPDERLILTASADKSIILWDSTTGEPLRRFVGHSTSAFAQFNGDGTIIISYGEGGEVIAWDVEIPEEGLKDWVLENRYIPDFTCEQRDLYDIEPLCEPT